MKKQYINLLLGSVLLLGYQHARAQLYNDGLMTNNGSLVSDWQNQWVNSANAVYDGTNNGVFEHHGPSSQTFVNNGTYNATTGHIDKFMGPLGAAGPQEITGSSSPGFYNLELGNGAGQAIHILNTAGANVRNLATFSNGITTTVRANTNAGALRFGDGATYTGGNTDAQHVDGYAGKIGNDAFVFPVGSATDYRPLTIAAPASSTAELTTAYQGSNVESANAVAGPVQSVYTLGSWDWIAGAASS